MAPAGQPEARPNIPPLLSVLREVVNTEKRPHYRGKRNLIQSWLDDGTSQKVSQDGDSGSHRLKNNYSKRLVMQVFLGSFLNFFLVIGRNRSM